MMNNQLYKGTIVGLLAPVVAIVVYVAFYLEREITEVLNTLLAMDRLTHAISLSVLINLVIFFMKLKTNREKAAKGVLLATILYGLTIAFLKFI